LQKKRSAQRPAFFLFYVFRSFPSLLYQASRSFCLRFSDLFVSGFPNFLFENFLRFGHDLSVKYLFVQNIDEDRKPGFNHDLSERVLFGLFLFRFYGKLTPFPMFLCLL
jgi:hypothetical protein